MGNYKNILDPKVKSHIENGVRVTLWSARTQKICRKGLYPNQHELNFHFRGKSTETTNDPSQKSFSEQKTDGEAETLLFPWEKIPLERTHSKRN